MAEAGFEYRIDGGGWIDAGLGYDQDILALSLGAHSFEVRGYDENGVRGPISDEATMTTGTNGLQDADGAWIIDADGAYLSDAN